MAWDSNFASVSLLLHCDGADTSTTFTDSSTGPHTITAVGNAQIKTAQSKFGGASGGFDGTGDYLTADGDAEFAFGTGDFTIEMWVRLNTIGSSQYLYESNGSGEVNGPRPALLFDVTGAFFSYSVNGGYRCVATTPAVIDTWYHIAVCRSGSDTKLYINGVNEGATYSDSTSMTVGASAPQIGRLPFNNTQFLNGYVDDLRVTKGVARYTSNFTPPVTAFADTATPNITGDIPASAVPLSTLIHMTKDKRIQTKASRLTRSSNLPFNHIGI